MKKILSIKYQYFRTISLLFLIVFGAVLFIWSGEKYNTYEMKLQLIETRKTTRPIELELIEKIAKLRSQIHHTVAHISLNDRKNFSVVNSMLDSSDLSIDQFGEQHLVIRGGFNSALRFINGLEHRLQCRIEEVNFDKTENRRHAELICLIKLK